MTTLNQFTINPNLIASQYAVRGKLVIEANKMEKEINELKKAGKENPYNFDKIVYCNIGNPQICNQKPLSYVRQVLSLVEYPELMKCEQLFPADIRNHAKEIMSHLKCVGSTGAYTNSKGVLEFRENISQFISDRDGYGCSADSIFITDGASTGIKMLLNMLISHQKDGIMIPIPQYPLYSATITQLGGSQVNYYLDEDNNWAIDMESVYESYERAVSKGIRVKAFVVINPGNPTGQVLTEENMQKIIKFCHEKQICLLADEVYQENIWGETPFNSFRKVLMSMEEPYRSQVEMISFFSVSKGFYGECGKRGGYFQCENVDDFAMGQLYKMASINLCSNVVGQEVVELICNPPKEGDESYPQYVEEKEEILGSLKRKAVLLHRALNKCEGIECNEAMGALYLFPKLNLPQKFLAECEDKNRTPDEEYCRRMLHEIGVCTIPGSGFGQKEGTYHYRIAILPPEDEIEGVAKNISEFHAKFMNKYK